MRSQRQLKVGEEIRHVLAMLFQRGDVPWPHGFTVPMLTISEVQISPDLRTLRVFHDAGRGRETEENAKGSERHGGILSA
jgi:ribosome-binding factor A